jgi:hypothetical protein
MNNRTDVPFSIPNDLQDRAQALNVRVAAGEAMTMQHLADALGLPFEFVAVCIGLTMALQSGQPVIIDPRQLPKTN